MSRNKSIFQSLKEKKEKRGRLLILSFSRLNSMNNIINNITRGEVKSLVNNFEDPVLLAIDIIIMRRHSNSYQLIYNFVLYGSRYSKMDQLEFVEDSL